MEGRKESPFFPFLSFPFLSFRVTYVGMGFRFYYIDSNELVGWTTKLGAVFFFSLSFSLSSCVGSRGAVVVEEGGIVSRCRCRRCIWLTG